MMNNIFQQFQSFLQNPAQILAARGIPANAMQNPRAAVQQLMNNGQLSQQQFNQLQQMANNLRNNLMFSQIIGK